MSLKLNYAYFDGKKLPLSHENHLSDGGNHITIIVGKNSVGKSRFLSAIVGSFESFDRDGYLQKIRPFLAKKVPAVNNFSLFYQLNGYNAKLKVEMGKCNIDAYSPLNGHIAVVTPEKVIATSTSPYDKFPLKRGYDESKGKYRYLGTKDRTGHQSATIFLEKVIESLFRASDSSSQKLLKLNHVFDFLGYNPSIDVFYEFELPIHKILSLFQDNKQIDSNTTRLSRVSQIIENISQDENLKNNIISSIVALTNMASKSRGVLFSMSFSDDPLKHNLLEAFSHASLLRSHGLLRLSDIMLFRKDNNEGFSIREASSGQQCIIATILGIASEIEDNSLICIDEPEISLHPEWQETFIDLLMKTFDDYNGCHFLIATHSPQIISRVKGVNCSILNMETSELFCADDYYRRSADFQLATILSAPGFSNEYLSRECLSVISKISKGNIDADTHMKIKKLSSVRKLLNDSDPVAELIDAINLATGN